MNTNLLARAKRVLRDAERGVSAIIVALSMVAIMGATAIGFDIASLAYLKQIVRNAVDSAAQIGASQLGNRLDQASTGDKIKAAFDANYNKNYSGWGGNYPSTIGRNDAAAPNTANVLRIKFLCVVSNPTPSNLHPAPSSLDAYLTSGCDYTSTSPETISAADINCTSVACSVKCPSSTGVHCNSVSVSANVSIAYTFAPILHIYYGSTGAVTTLSCACGANPLNVVVMADRTFSMYNTTTQNANLSALKGGILDMLKIMTPEQQYVAFGAIHKSLPKTTSGNLTTPVGAADDLFRNTYSGTTYSSYNTQSKCQTQNGKFWNPSDSKCYSSRTRTNVFNGTWVPVAFSNNYLDNPGPAASVKTTTDLYQSVSNLSYSDTVSLTDLTHPYSNDGYWGNTHLASALKGAARYLLGYDTNNLASLDAASKRVERFGTPKNVIIMETDGTPSEVFKNASSDTDSALKLEDSSDIGNSDVSTGSGQTTARACANLVKVAQEAKDAHITVIMIGFGGVNTGTCGTGTGAALVRDVLAKSASPAPDGTASTARDCSVSTAAALAENTDGDNYFCAATKDQLANVFKSAFGALGGGSQFVSIPGVGN